MFSSLISHDWKRALHATLLNGRYTSCCIVCTIFSFPFHFSVHYWWHIFVRGFDAFSDCIFPLSQRERERQRQSSVRFAHFIYFQVSAETIQLKSHRHNLVDLIFFFNANGTSSNTTTTVYLHKQITAGKKTWNGWLLGSTHIKDYWCKRRNKSAPIYMKTHQKSYKNKRIRMSNSSSSGSIESTNGKSTTELEKYTFPIHL